MCVAHATVCPRSPEDNLFTLVLCFHHVSPGDSHRSSSLATNAGSFRATVPVLDFVFNYKGSPDYHLKCRADKSEWPAVAIGSAVFTFPRTRHLKFTLTCTSSGTTAGRRSPDPAAVGSCSSDSKVSASQNDSVGSPPPSPASPVLTAMSSGCLSRQLFLLSLKPVVHTVAGIILYGQWPGQGQTV